ncbi:MAG TPA: hypothetical protein VJT72_16010, partial [Pseudonocardiaceae bacterium]|nr:hypothetical protein [Pseudonocardiaceae bacterium]
IDSSPWWGVWASAPRRSTSPKTMATIAMPSPKTRGRAVVSTPRRWALSPHDQRSHLLAERGTGKLP